MNEAKFQSKFTRWSAYKLRGRGTVVCELKICKKKSLPYSSFAPHQLANLKNAKDIGFAYKIADVGIGQKPFDCLFIKAEEAWCVIQFYENRVKHFYMIDIDLFLSEIANSDRKSITEERALEIGIRCEFP